jgi:hypothetical protein
MGRPQYIPSFFFYKFAQTLADPYTSFEAYRAGNIDASGNITGNESNIDPFEYFVIKLKKILEELPPGSTKYKTNNLFGVLQLFSEHAENFGITNEDFQILVEAELMAKELTEDMTTGGAAGALGTPAEAPGANKGNVSGYDPVMGSMATRSGPVNMFASVEMFNIPTSEYKLFKLDKGYPKTSTGNYVRRYGQRNSGQKLAVRDEESGEIYWLPATNKKTFVETYNLKNLKLLDESVVGDYTDSVKDDEINVATRTNAQEIEPLEISGKELKTTAEIVRQRYEDEKQKEDERRKQPYLKAGSAEKYAAGTELEKSIPTALEIMKRLGNKGAEIAQKWHGQFRHSAEKEISTHGEPDYYGLGNLEGLEDLENPEDLIKAFDAKNIKARGQVNIDPTEFFKDTEVGGVKGFPTVSGTPAHIARALAAKAGDTREAARIRSDVLTPFYSDPGVQDRLRTHYMTQTFPQNNDVSLRLATKKGRELIPIGVADAETILRKGIAVRTTRGGSQPVEKSKLGIQSSSDFGVIAVGKNNPLQTLSREDQSSLERLSPELKRFSSWLRTT